ncbi:uncharacterized protein LOC110413240 [Herrania umbratica]|uniref:Uncharacterized protein LOC110413240 n=1 Tax=Herrania umbratica TaxID=108875 RepID=A0A6J0ZZC8_9ROSI|nr:uncharacterized protein LOC110413240 [Herrania umbratica]
MFQQAGAVKAQEITTGPAGIQTEAESFNNKKILQSSCSWNLWKQLMKEATESSTDTQNALMVVAVLIVTITYQAILSPPSGFWSAESKNSTTVSTHVVQKRSRTMTPGGTIMCINPPIFSVFIGFNSIGFIASVAMIFLLTSGFPLKAGFRLAMFSMIGTYVVAIIYTGPTKMSDIYMTVTVMGILFLAEFARFTIWLFKKWRVGPDTRRKH